jgi:hypothetical protein
VRKKTWGSSLVGAGVFKGDFNTVNYVEPSTPASLETSKPCVFPDGKDERDMAATLDSQRFHGECFKVQNLNAWAFVASKGVGWNSAVGVVERFSIGDTPNEE